jgi:putative Mg2+ transporter-C (MgtC) family protein
VDFQYFWPLFSAVVAGGLIGLEREWRGRAAGFRTHILVCLASSLLMQAAVTQSEWAFSLLPDENIVTDPTRMAHGVLTGIGFLCAGVIFRTGFSIHGLTTAASLWITAAIGLLFGAGLYTLGISGTVVTGVILIVLRLISLRVPTQMLIDAEVCWRRGAASPEAEVEAALAAIDAGVRADSHELVDQGRTVRRTWRLKTGGSEALKGLAERLRAIEAVSAYRLDPRDD